MGSFIQRNYARCAAYWQAQGHPPTGQDNYMVLGLSEEIVVKQHYWVRLDDGTAGNAMFTHGVARSAKTEDFLVKLRGMSFNTAMETLQPAGLPSSS